MEQSLEPPGVVSASPVFVSGGYYRWANTQEVVSLISLE